MRMVARFDFDSLQQEITDSTAAVFWPADPDEPLIAVSYSQPFVLAIRAASTRLLAPSLLIASER
jgi:hypothetical protein